MPETDPPPLKTRRRASATAEQAPKAKRTANAKVPAQTTDAKPPAAPTSADTEAAPAEATAETPETVESETPTQPDGVSTETQAPQTEATPPVDPFNYNESTLTLSLSFLPLTEGAVGRTVIVSVHSKNGTGKAVLPEFMAPLHEGDLKLPPSVLALMERYRTVTLPKRKAEADAKAAELAAKRPVSSKKGKDLRPAHVTAGTTAKRAQATGVSTQFKLNFGKK